MGTAIDNILIFSTDVLNRHRAQRVKWVLDQHPDIADWNVDYQDKDKVLRIEADDGLTESDVIDIMKTFGFHCEVLPD